MSLHLIEPYRYGQLNLDNIVYSKTKQLNQKKIIYIKYNDNSHMNQFVFQCPTLLNINKPQVASDEYHELEIPITTQDSNKQQNFIDFLEKLDDKIINDNKNNDWTSDMTSNIKYKRMLKETNNEHILKLKLIKSKDFETNLQTDSNKRLKPSDIPLNTWCKILLEVYAVVINMKFNTYNILIRPIIISFKEKFQYNYSLIEDSDENDDDNVLDTEVNNIFLKQVVQPKVSINTYSDVKQSNNQEILSSVVLHNVSNDLDKQEHKPELLSLVKTLDEPKIVIPLIFNNKYDTDTSSSSDKLVLSDTTTSE